jgi:hypothetical protein
LPIFPLLNWNVSEESIIAVTESDSLPVIYGSSGLVKNEIPLYFDDDHRSVSGAAILVELIR